MRSRHYRVKLIIGTLLVLASYALILQAEVIESEPYRLRVEVVTMAAVGGVACLVVAGLIIKVRQRLRQSALTAGQGLLSATERGDIEQIQALLAKRVEVNARNAQGWTSLHVAAAGGDIAVVELLLRHGADVNVQSHVGATPLDHAITYSQKRAVVALLEAHGAQGNTSWDALS